MKVEIKEETKSFKPFDLIIRVESIEELKQLWHTFNVDANISSGGKVVYQAQRHILEQSINDISVWSILDSKLNESI